MAAPQNYVSVSRRPPDVEDYIDMMRRYRSWIIGPTFAGLVISVVMAYFSPDVYVCRATMQIRPSAVSSTLMPVAINNEMAERLQELGREILGRDNLIMLIQMPKLNLYQKERQKYSVEDVADDTFHKHVKIVPYEQSGANGVQAFSIVFEYPDKNVARAVVAELVNEFDNKNLVFQQENATSTSTLYNDLVKNATDKLDQRQKALADYVSENSGRLPEDVQANLSQIQTLRQSIDNMTMQLGQETQRQTTFETQLNNNKAQQSDAETNLRMTVNTPGQAVKNNDLNYIEQQITNKKSECAALDKRYMPDMPNVQECKESERSLEAEYDKVYKNGAAPAVVAGTTRVVANPEAERALRQLQATEQEIRTQIATSIEQQQQLRKILESKNRDLTEVQEKISTSPQVIQKYNRLYADLQEAKDEYTSLSTKKQAAGTQQQVEEHRAGEKLEILENPITPEKPTSPIRGAWVAIGTMLGLVFGVALAGAKEVKNASLKNLKDVRAYTNLPVLSSIPLLENALLVRRKRRLSWLAWSSALILGTFLMSGAMYYHFVIVPQV